MAQRKLTAAEVQLGEVLDNRYMAPEMRVAELLRIVEALVNENLAPAMSRARAEALEEAAILMQAGHVPSCYERPTPEGTTPMQFGCGNCSRATSIRALITTPVPATIPVEMVREALSAEHRRAGSAGARMHIEEVAQTLGVDLDTKETCPGCGHPPHQRGKCHRLGEKGLCVCAVEP